MEIRISIYDLFVCLWMVSVANLITLKNFTTNVRLPLRQIDEH